MRKLILASALLFPFTASASDYSPAFALSGVVQDVRYTAMELDITAHKRYLAANGVLMTDNGLAAPVTGTCQFSMSGGVYCILQQGHLSYLLDVGANLSGTLRAQDQNGNIFSTLAVTYLGME